MDESCIGYDSLGLYKTPRTKKSPAAKFGCRTGDQTYLSLFKNMRFFDLFSEKSPYAVGVKRK